MTRSPTPVLTFLVLCVVSGSAGSGTAQDPVSQTAQSEAEASRSSRRPYLFGTAAFGRCNHDFTIFGGGGGAELFPGRRVGVGADLGYYQFSDENSFGLYSLTVAFHFPGDGERGRVDPYVSISPGLYTSEVGQSGGAFGFGGGLNYWFSDRWGLHTDLRAALLGTEEGIVLVRVGIAFR